MEIFNDTKFWLLKNKYIISATKNINVRKNTNIKLKYLCLIFCLLYTDEDKKTTSDAITNSGIKNNNGYSHVLLSSIPIGIELVYKYKFIDIFNRVQYSPIANEKIANLVLLVEASGSIGNGVSLE